MMYSVGKDSSVLLHLLVKAFYPAKPPIPLLHVDTGWKFREMIEFRDRRAAETGVELRPGPTRTAWPRASARSATAPRSTPT
jgi:sulfate adenylyltransferase subunit 2